MVTKFFRQLGIIRFIYGYIKYKRFQFAFKKCDRLNRKQPGKHIVVSYDNRPIILNKSIFRSLKRDNFFGGMSWQDIVKKQVTSKDF